MVHVLISACTSTCIGPYPELYISTPDEVLRKHLLGNTISPLKSFSDVVAFDYNFMREVYNT